MLKTSARASAVLTLPAAILFLPACQIEPPFIHERFAELRPARVTVAPVENHTLVDLTKVSTAGALQRLTFGGGGVDVLSALSDGLREALIRKGYDVDAVPSPPDPPEGGVLECAVTQFSAESASSGGGIELAGELTLRQAGEKGEVIFQRNFRHSSGRSPGGSRTAAEIDGEVRRVGLGLLAGLPPRDPDPAAAAAR